jgi:hypothetical protein
MDPLLVAQPNIVKVTPPSVTQALNNGVNRSFF